MAQFGLLNTAGHVLSSAPGSFRDHTRSAPRTEATSQGQSISYFAHIWKLPKSEVPIDGEKLRIWGGGLQVLAISGVGWGQRFLNRTKRPGFVIDLGTF